MTPAEIAALGRLGGHAFAGLVSRIEQVHQAVASRAFAPAGPAGTPTQVIHDSIAGGVYLVIRGAGTTAAALAGKTVSLIGAGGQPADRAPGGNLALAALNAVAGDQLGPGLSSLAIRMAVRADGHDVGLVPQELAERFRTPRPSWRSSSTGWPRRRYRGTAERRIRSLRPAAASGIRLHARLCPIQHRTARVRNGHELARLLDGLMAAWPQQAEELLLIGHSMGGLVIRSACHDGRQESAAWADMVGDVFYLGSPHLGAPLARAAGIAGWVFSHAAETRPFVTLVNGSSPGIKDLRHGYVIADDWAGCDQDSCVRDHRHDTPLLAGANHYTISATITADPGHPLGAVAGDLLVRPASAHGRRGAHQHIPFPAGSRRGLGGMHHFDLLNHPTVWIAIRGLLGNTAH